MGLNVLFAVLLVAFIAIWAFWLYGISKDSVRMMVGGGIAIAAAAAVLIAVNSERLDRQRQSYGEQAIAVLSAVESAQEEEFLETGSYVEEIELPDDLVNYDEGALTFERDASPDFRDVSERGYAATVDLEGQEFVLTVSRSGGQPAQERTCEADSDSCVDGTWQPDAD